MYLAFYNLRDKAFGTQPDPSFLWLGPKYAEALSVMRKSIFETQGFLLTGDAGTGKTTLVNALTRSFDKSVEWAVINDPGLGRLEFYNAIAKGFGIDREFSSRVQFILQFSAFLHKALDEGKRVALLVDDCHRLSQDMLEDLRHLSNIEKAGVRLVTLCCIGRRDFLETLMQPNNRPFGQRLSLKVDLAPLTLSETEAYIRHRLKVAGTEEELFTAKAIQIVYRAALGNPRVVNTICDQALIAGATEGNGLVGRKSVEECLAQLNLPYVSHHADDARTGEKNRAHHLLHSIARTFELKKSEILTAFHRWFQADNPRTRWAMFSLGLVLIGGIGISFLQGENGEKTATDAGKPSVQQPPAREKARETLPPAVGKLEPIGKAIDLNMVVAARKEALVKKEGEEKKSPEGNTALDETREKPPPETADPPVGRVPEPAVSGKTGEEIAAAPHPKASDQQVLSQGNVAGKESAGEPGKNGAETPLKPGAEPVKPEAVKKVDQPPPKPPAKVVLPLRPNSLALTEEAEKDYGEFVARLKEYPKAKLLVKGFVSAKTNSPENIKLSEERALGVQKLLVKSGIDPARITVKGMGNQEPLAANDSSEGRTKNRRVEVEVVGDGR